MFLVTEAHWRYEFKIHEITKETPKSYMVKSKWRIGRYDRVPKDSPLVVAIFISRAEAEAAVSEAEEIYNDEIRQAVDRARAAAAQRSRLETQRSEHIQELARVANKETE